MQIEDAIGRDAAADAPVRLPASTDNSVFASAAGALSEQQSPLPPQHRDRVERHQRLREVNTDPEAFWSRHKPSVESFDHLIRACGMQEQVPRARAYFEEMEFVGLTPAASQSTTVANVNCSMSSGS